MQPYPSRRDKYFKLFNIAREQGGVFSAKQAVAAGFDQRNHPHYVKNGLWAKEYRGIYRLVQYPPDPVAQYAVWSLWSCNRKGECQGVYSHETALTMHQLTDVNPAKIHMTVSSSFRKTAKTPAVLVLYRNQLTAEDWLDKGGYRVTTPARTLYDIMTSERISEEFVYQAVEEGLEAGLYPTKDLVKYGILDRIDQYR